MTKYRLTRLALEADTSVQGLLEIREVTWQRELAGLGHAHRYPQTCTHQCLTIRCNHELTNGLICFLAQAPQATKEELALAHDPGYVQRFIEGQLNPKEMRSIGFPWSEGLVRRARASAGGTLAATRALLEWQLRVTANIAGKT